MDAEKTMSDWIKINPDYKIAIMFACHSDRTADIYNDLWKKNAEQWDRFDIIRENNGTLERAPQAIFDHGK